MRQEEEEELRETGEVRMGKEVERDPGAGAEQEAWEGEKRGGGVFQECSPQGCSG